MLVDDLFLTISWILDNLLLLSKIKLFIIFLPLQPQVITIFRYLQDKDIFESYYKLSFAKRLLGGRTSSDENEKKLISKLKGECGHQYTQKLEGMLSDMAKSTDQTREFAKEVPVNELGMEVRKSFFGAFCIGSVA